MNVIRKECALPISDERAKMVESNLKRWDRIASTTEIPAALSAMGEYETIMANARQILENGGDPREAAIETTRMLRTSADEMRRTAERIAVGAYEMYRVPGEPLAEALNVSRTTFIRIREKHETDLF